MDDKSVFLASMDAIKATIEKLPDDVIICGINNRYKEGITIQIIHHPDVVGERVEARGLGEDWHEIPGDVTVGWLYREGEDDDETL